MYKGKFQPINRHLKIIPHLKENKTNSGVLLPEDFEPQQERYIPATVVSYAKDCSRQLVNYFLNTTCEKTVVVDRSMVEEVTLNNKKHYLVLENYVMGFIEEL